MEVQEYRTALTEALNARQDWLEKTELVKLKDTFRLFHNAFSTVYNLLLQKKLINEDPYKHEAKMREIEPPKPIVEEGSRMAQLSIGLSAYDNQLDFLVNFYTFTVDFLTMDTTKRILNLLKYIDWGCFAVENPQPTTKAVAEVVTQAQAGVDPITAGLVREALSNLNKTSNAVRVFLKEVSNFNREAYKLDIRTTISGKMQAGEATVDGIRKRFAAAMPGRPFYSDLVEEVIREDYSAAGSKLQADIIKALGVPESKPKMVVKGPVSFKSILFDGLLVIGSVGPTLSAIALRLIENQEVLESRKKGLWETLRKFMQQVMSREPDPVIYDIEYKDIVKGIMVKERVNFSALMPNMERKARILSAIAGRSGMVSSRLVGMDEKQLLGMLEKTIREIQALHKTLTGLDEYFKVAADKENRDKIKGIKPDLGTIKNAIVKANQKRYEYSAQVEEEEQLKHLGIKAEA